VSAALPLAGRTVLVTRGTAKGDRLGQLLAEAGATVVRVPLIAVERLPGSHDLTAAVGRLRAARPHAWLVLTSQAGVDVLLDSLGELGARTALDGVRIAVVGPATQAALRSRGVDTDLVSAGQTAQSLGEELAARRPAPTDVLVVAAAGGRDVTATLLRAAGARVEVVTAYRSVLPAGAAAALRDALVATVPDAVTFTSGSTVANFSSGLGGSPLPGCPAVCIGPVTAAAARHAGWASVITAEEHTAQGVVAATVQVLGAERLP
jgi:uroporphyrinogen III methyltransferase/synthase